MRSEVKEVSVGALVMVGLLAMIAFSYGGREIKAEPGFPVLAAFGKVDGLREGDQVRVGGIQVGRVSEQRLRDGFRAEVVMRLNDGVVLPRDTSAAIHTDGLFGSKYIVLEPGGDEEILKAGDEIAYTQDAVVVEDLLELIIAQGKSRRAAQQATDDAPAPASGGMLGGN